MSTAFLYDAVRTPFGRFDGALSKERPDDLAATVLRAVADRTPGLDTAEVDEVVLGLANGARLMLSTPPAITRSASPVRISRAAEATASSPDPHSRLIVEPGTVTG